MAGDDKPRRSSRAGGPRRARASAEHERLSGITHELAGQVLTLRLLIHALSAGATPAQHESLRRLGELVEAQAALARALSELSRPPPETRGSKA